MYDPRRSLEPPTAADLINTEDAQVKSGNATGCGHTCPGCHGGLTCIRIAHGDDQAHVGRDANGQLVQWHGACDAETHTAALSAAEQTKADQVEQLREHLAGLDPDVLRDFLNGATQ